MITNTIQDRLKKGESTLCTFTTTKEEIIEGHILGYGDNYPCIVFYDKFEGRFCLIEFGYQNYRYKTKWDYRYHDLRTYTVPFKILGHIDNPEDYHKYLYGKHVPKNFSLTKDLSQWYKEDEA